jgi:hypothetical protein
MYLHGPQTTTTTTTTTKDNRQFVKTETTSGPSAAQVLTRGGSRAAHAVLPRCSQRTHGGTQEGAHGLLTGCSQDTHASGTHGGTRRCSQQEGSHGLGTHGVLTVTLSARAPYACSSNHRRWPGWFARSGIPEYPYPKPDSRFPRGLPMGMGAHRVLEGILWSVQDPNVVRMLHLGSF